MSIGTHLRLDIRTSYCYILPAVWKLAEPRDCVVSTLNRGNRGVVFRRQTAGNFERRNVVFFFSLPMSLIGNFLVEICGLYDLLVAMSFIGTLSRSEFTKLVAYAYFEATF